MLTDEWITTELKGTTQQQQQRQCRLTLRGLRVYSYFPFLCLDCLNRTTIVHILSAKSVACISFSFHNTDSHEETEQLYADAEMSRHVLGARIQTFYISFDFGITRVWNRNDNNSSGSSSTTENILRIRRPFWQTGNTQIREMANGEWRMKRVRMRDWAMNAVAEYWICMWHGIGAWTLNIYDVVLSNPCEKCSSTTQYFIR